MQRSYEPLRRAGSAVSSRKAREMGSAGTRGVGNTTSGCVVMGEDI